ncbi:MAG: signal peptidase II [Clostridia bacterium]|nr:signal peptidase II [Clostridia bacterium]
MIIALTGILVTGILLFIDLFTKALAQAYLEGAKVGDMFLGIVRLEFQRNDGIAWSMFDKNPVAMTIVTILTIVMIIAIAVAYFTLARKNAPARIALAVIEAGAIGNLVDRLCLNYVRDFIHIDLILPAYTCNVADMYIVLGAIVLVFIILFIGKDAAFPITKKWREEAKAEEAAAEKKKRKRK